MMDNNKLLQLRHQAGSFLTAYINLTILNSQVEDVTFTIPMIVNGAFSAELALKALLTKEGIQYSKNHNLLYLFSLLPVDIALQIVNDSMSRTPAFRVLENWLDNLIYISNAFEEWRYAYEANHSLVVDTNFLQAFAQACNQVLSNQFGGVSISKEVSVGNEEEIEQKIDMAKQQTKEAVLKKLQKNKKGGRYQ